MARGPRAKNKWRVVQAVGGASPLREDEAALTRQLRATAAAASAAVGVAHAVVATAQRAAAAQAADVAQRVEVQVQLDEVHEAVPPLIEAAGEGVVRERERLELAQLRERAGLEPCALLVANDQLWGGGIRENG